MRVEFSDAELRRLYFDGEYRVRGIGPELTSSFRRKVGVLVNAKDTRDLYAMKSLHFEKLNGDRAGQRSVRLDQQWRLIMTIEADDEGQLVNIVEIVDYH